VSPARRSSITARPRMKRYNFDEIPKLSAARRIQFNRVYVVHNINVDARSRP
jgi:hypothetical protein